jgi:hypothetical protein
MRRRRRTRRTIVRIHRSGALVALMLVLSGGALAQAPVDTVQAVRSGLAMMDQVVDRTGQLVQTKTYDSLPREAANFEPALATLEAGVAHEPSDFRQRLGPLLAKARVAASGMSEAVKSHNEPMIILSQRLFAAAVQAAIGLFPAALQPKPRAPQG